ncbi:hypothetical protein IF2G_06025 [Cordyceps javanica]|nr:hypothetical protein IF2G_06025 [Cordyceps javanica]
MVFEVYDWRRVNQVVGHVLSSASASCPKIFIESNVYDYGNLMVRNIPTKRSAISWVGTSHQRLWQHSRTTVARGQSIIHQLTLASSNTCSIA